MPKAHEPSPAPPAAHTPEPVERKGGSYRRRNLRRGHTTNSDGGAATTRTRTMTEKVQHDEGP